LFVISHNKSSVHGDESFKNIAHVPVFLGSINICLKYTLTPFRPNPRHPATKSQSFLFSVNIFSHSAFGGGNGTNFFTGSRTRSQRPRQDIRHYWRVFINL